MPNNNFTSVKLKKSNVAGKQPTIDKLDYGELAINYTDGRLYYKTASNQIDYFISSTASGVPSLQLVTNEGATTSNEITIDNNLNVDSIILSAPPTGGTVDAARKLYWDEDTNTLAVGLDGEVVLQVGQESLYYVKADGESISKGDVVYASGVVGGSSKLLAKKFIADNTIDELYVLGVADQDIAIGEFGYVAQFGAIRQFDTTGPSSENWQQGDILYASPDVAGALTNVQPIAPDLDIPVAIITDLGANGSIFVRPTRSSHLDELHDVYYPTTPATNELLRWGSTGRWENVSFTAGDGVLISNTSSNIQISNTGVLSVNSVTGNVTATQLLDAIKTVDGPTSGLDADLLDGQQGSYYNDYTNLTNVPDVVESYVSSVTYSGGELTIAQTGGLANIVVDIDPLSTYTTTGTGVPILIDSFSANTYRSAEYSFQSEGPNGFQRRKYLLIHGGLSVESALIENVSVGTENGHFSFEYNGSTTVVEVYFTPYFETIYLKWTKSLFSRTNTNGVGLSGDLEEGGGNLDLQTTNFNTIDLN